MLAPPIALSPSKPKSEMSVETSLDTAGSSSVEPKPAQTRAAQVTAVCENVRAALEAYLNFLAIEDAPIVNGKLRIPEHRVLAPWLDQQPDARPILAADLAEKVSRRDGIDAPSMIESGERFVWDFDFSAAVKSILFMQQSRISASPASSLLSDTIIPAIRTWFFDSLDSDSAKYWRLIPSDENISFVDVMLRPEFRGRGADTAESFDVPLTDARELRAARRPFDDLAMSLATYWYQEIDRSLSRPVA